MNIRELEEELIKWKEPRFRARQVFSWVYKRGAQDFRQMSDLAQGLRTNLEEKFFLSSLKPVSRVKSFDGTQKFLFALRDESLIEAVLIPAEGRLTGCVSTQAGCKFACSFCASAMKGFKRDLSAGEMVDQALYPKNNSGGRRLTHLVFMGMGEPLDNYDNVLKAIRIINSPDGLNIGARRITVSTCGIIPGIRRLAGEALQIELSVSLHASLDSVRSRIMPVNKKYPLKELIAACRQYIEKTDRQITFEYILIEGVNSGLQSAQNLSKILRGLNCKVNIIPVNSLKECGLEPPGKVEILLFRDYLLKHGVKATLRRPRGQDIEAACGQLRLKYENR